MSDEASVPRLIPTRSDRDIAEDLRRRFEIVLAPVRDLAEEAGNSEFMVSLAFGRDPFGRLTLSAKLIREF